VTPPDQQRHFKKLTGTLDDSKLNQRLKTDRRRHSGYPSLNVLAEGPGSLPVRCCVGGIGALRK
jgi:hypothetical protein